MLALPRKLAKLLLGSYAALALGYNLYWADGLHVVLLNLVFLPWLVGPAIVCAALAAKVPSRAMA